MLTMVSLLQKSKLKPLNEVPLHDYPYDSLKLKGLIIPSVSKNVEQL